MVDAMEPATPSSVMGDSEASGQLGGTEKDAGITIYVPPEQMQRVAAGYAPGVAKELALEIHNRGSDAGFMGPDLSDMLLASLYPMPKGYILRPKNRHERRKNRALLRDGWWLSPIWQPGPIAAPAVDGAALRIITEFRV